MDLRESMVKCGSLPNAILFLQSHYIGNNDEPWAFSGLYKERKTTCNKGLAVSLKEKKES